MLLYNRDMDTQVLLEILTTQSTLGRTGKGWDLGEGMLGASQTSAESSSNEGFVAKECLNCGVVLSGEFFPSGCPNCGCKDTQDFGDKVGHPVSSVSVGSFTGKTGSSPTRQEQPFYVVGGVKRKAR